MTTSPKDTTKSSMKERNLPTEERNSPTEERNSPTEERNLPTEERDLPTEERDLSTEERKSSMKERFQKLIAEYGPIAIGIHFSLFFASVFGFWLAIGMGIEVGGDSSIAPGWLTGSGSARLVAAYVASQLIKPVRLGLVVILTPAVGRLLRRAPDPAEGTPPLASVEEPSKLEG